LTVPGPGAQLSHFRLLEKIGEGGAGAVWKAHDTQLDREVAVKFLPQEMAQDPERLARFKEEARAVAALNHPNIVTIFSFEESGQTHFLTMELIRGQTLNQLIPSRGFPVNEFLELALPLLEAIQAAHEQGLTHRDLKPNNVMVGDDGRVKILDFGLATFRHTDRNTQTTELPTQTLTQEGTLRGTMPYMSPEQVQEKPLDQRSDVFSLGVLLYEMATARRPFRGDTAADLIAAILRDLPRPVDQMISSQPPRLGQIIGRCLEKELGRRYQTVRELRRDLEVLQAELEAGKPVDAAGPRSAAARVRSLAVLPLENLSGDTEQEFFADGMTDALITDLARIGALKVISRSSVMRYKGARPALREIGEELGVDAVIEGSILRAGDRVRIIAQLIDAATDEHLWAESYERELRDVLALQSDVAQAIAKQIEVELTSGERARLDSPGQVDPAAHEACLKGRFFWYKRTNEAVQKGLECFREAMRLDPDYAPAYAGVADSYLVDGGSYLGVPSDEAYPRAREAAVKALALDDGLAEAHTSLAAAMSDYDWDWAGAEREYRRAIELNPNYVTAHFWFADHLSRVGRHDEAIEQARRAVEIDPLSLTGRFMVAWTLYFARRFDQAIEQARKALELDVNYPPAHRVLGWAREECGEYAEAIAAHRQATELSGNALNFKASLGRAFALAGRKEDARKILAEVTGPAGNGRIPSFAVAVIHTALGEHDAAFEWLTRACDEHSEHIPYLKVSPRLDPLRSDPRFAKLLARLKLTD